MVLRSPRRLERASIERPTPGPEEILVRTTHGGICGTDLSLYTGAMPTQYPKILGHEIVGEVVEGGDGELSQGQRVVVDPALFCGRCYCCGAGLTNLCLQGGLIGREVDGGFAEFVVVPRHHVFPLADVIESRVAPLVQVLTTCRHAQGFVDTSRPWSAVVTGLGVTGQLHVQLAKASGARLVIGVTRSLWKRELAERLGADLTFPHGGEATAAVLEATEGLGADVVIECTGKAKVIEQGVSMARPGGTIVLFGTCTETRSELSFMKMYFKELRVLNTRAAKGVDFPASLDLAASGAVKLEPLITCTAKMSQLGEAMQLLESDADRRMKVVLENTW